MVKIIFKQEKMFWGGREGRWNKFTLKNNKQTKKNTNHNPSDLQATDTLCELHDPHFHYLNILDVGSLGK